MTLSNLKTENNLVENAKEEKHSRSRYHVCIKYKVDNIVVDQLVDSQSTAAIDRMSSFSNVSCFS